MEKMDNLKVKEEELRRLTEWSIIFEYIQIATDIRAEINTGIEHRLLKQETLSALKKRVSIDMESLPIGNMGR